MWISPGIVVDKMWIDSVCPVDEYYLALTSIVECCLVLFSNI